MQKIIPLKDNNREVYDFVKEKAQTWIAAKEKESPSETACVADIMKYIEFSEAQEAQEAEDDGYSTEYDDDGEFEDEEAEEAMQPDPCRSNRTVPECWEQENCKYHSRKGCTELDVDEDQADLKRLWDERVQEEAAEAAEAEAKRRVSINLLKAEEQRRFPSLQQKLANHIGKQSDQNRLDRKIIRNIILITFTNKR